MPNFVKNKRICRFKSVVLFDEHDIKPKSKHCRIFVVGKPNRWETIAEILERLPSEVPKMAQKIKNNAFMVPNYQQSQGMI